MDSWLSFAAFPDLTTNHERTDKPLLNHMHTHNPESAMPDQTRWGDAKERDLIIDGHGFSEGPEKYLTTRSDQERRSLLETTTMLTTERRCSLLAAALVDVSSPKTIQTDGMVTLTFGFESDIEAIV